MYGLIGKMLAAEGARDDLVRVMLEGMPGCLGYVIATDPAWARRLQQLDRVGRRPHGRVVSRPKVSPPYSWSAAPGACARLRASGA